MTNQLSLVIASPIPNSNWIELNWLLSRALELFPTHSHSVFLYVVLAGEKSAWFCCFMCGVRWYDCDSCAHTHVKFSPGSGWCQRLWTGGGPFFIDYFDHRFAATSLLLTWKYNSKTHIYSDTLLLKTVNSSPTRSTHIHFWWRELWQQRFESSFDPPNAIPVITFY